ncbi:serine/threonine-protein kinase BCK1/SLK1/SSP31-like [Cucumis melo var. makuwa]|uniref:Serine/threonine-protein kinase BCK1/SLK1/SSP31-like n=1 Tax=Cucumis melo var. makuwa TaxID=1194695 RepID=A0A5D3BYT6_CUCMM|nr:serine/threonine-protein kinase BCK1/SLK1/SSP31-like [Cucumis melo var. makuwa]
MTSKVLEGEDQNDDILGLRNTKYNARPPSHVGRLQLRPPPPFRDSFRDPAPADVTPPVSPFQLPPPPQVRSHFAARLGALAILRKWTFTIFCASLTLPKKLQLGRKSNCDNAISQSDDSHGNEDEELAVIVEGVTHSMPPDILLASGIVLQVENKASDEFPSSRGNDALNSSSETDHEDADSILSSSDESMSEAAIAEIEAGIYGLQIIKDADLEEVQELGSGTFCSTVMAVVTYLEKTFSYVSLLAGSPRPNASLDYTFFLSNCIGHWPGLFRFAHVYNTLQTKLTRTLLNAFLDTKRSLTQHYGAIQGLATLGMNVAE